MANIYQKSNKEFTQQRGFWGIPVGPYRQGMTKDAILSSPLAGKEPAG